MCDSDSGLSISMNGSQTDAPCQSVIFIRLTCPELELESVYNFSPTDVIMDIKMNIISSIDRPLKDKWNYGLFLPPSKGKAGKFLQEDRMLKEYPFDSSVGHLELKYKQRVYRVLKTNLNKLKKIHVKSNLKNFLDCVKSGDVDKVSKWLNKGLDPNFQWKDGGETPLTLAVKSDKPREMIMALVAGGAHLDYRAADTMTPLHRAASFGNYEAIKVLLDLGQSPNTRDQFELTPLYYAVLNDTVALCVERLLYDHSVLGKSDEAGLQEIHQACRFGRVQHLETLLAYGADINSQTAKNGNTPLHICAFTGQESCARLLLFRGADRTLLNRAGHTAHQQAVLVENTAVADLIRTFQAKDVVPLRVNPKRNERRRSVHRICPQQRCASLGRLSNYEKLSDTRTKNSGYEDNNSANDLSHSNTTDYGDYRMTSSVSGYCLDTMLLEDDHCNGLHNKLMFDSTDPYTVETGSSEHHLSQAPPTSPPPSLPSPTGRPQQNPKPGGVLLSQSACNLRSNSGKQYGRNQVCLFDGDYSATVRVSKTNSFKIHPSQANRSGTGRLSTGQMSRPPLDHNWMQAPNSQLQHSLQQPENGSDTASIFSTNSSIRGLHTSNSFTSATSQLQMLINGQGSILDLDTSNLPRVVVLQKGPRGFGFVVRGRRGVPGEFQPTLEVPALQYLEKVESGSAANRAGLKSGDFILEVNGTNVSTMSHEAVVQLIRNSGETLGMKVITVPVTLSPSMSSMISLDQTQSSGMMRQSNGHSDPRSTQNSTSNELDCGSVYSTSTNGTMRPGIFGHQDQVQTVNDSAVSNPSDDQSLGVIFNFKAQTPAKPSAQLTSSVIPPPPPSKSPRFSRSSLTSPPPSSIPVSPVTSVPPPPPPPLSPKQLSPIVPPKPKTQNFPPPPPPHVLSSLSSDSEMGTLTHKNTGEQAFSNSELSQVQLRNVQPKSNLGSAINSGSTDFKLSRVQMKPQPPVPPTLVSTSIPPPPPLLPSRLSSVSRNDTKPSPAQRNTSADGFDDDLPLPPPPDKCSEPQSPQTRPACPLMQGLLNRVNNAGPDGPGSFVDHLREAIERRRQKIEMNFSEEDEFDDDDTSRSSYGKSSRSQNSTFYTVGRRSSTPAPTVPPKPSQLTDAASPNRTINRVLVTPVPPENSFKAAAEKFHAKALARTIGLSNTIPPPDNFKDNSAPQSTTDPIKSPIFSSIVNKEGPKYAGSTLGRTNGASKMFYANGLKNQTSESAYSGKSDCGSIMNLR